MGLYSARSQESLSISYNKGSVVAHTPKVEHLIQDESWGFTINYSLPNKKGENWRPYFNYPNYGFSYNYKTYGYNEVLGNSHSLTSFIQLPFLKKRKYFDLGFEGYTGVGYISKIYDPENNPTNNAISAHVNISADIRVYSKLRLKPVFIQYSVGLNHISNGLIKAPNLGINVANSAFTVGYEFEEQPAIIKPKKEERSSMIKNEYWFYVASGIKEIDDFAQKYMFISASLNYSKQISQINKLGLGYDFIHDPTLPLQAEQKFEEVDETGLNFRHGINIQNEFLMGKTSFFAAYGFYYRNSKYYVSRRYYKVGFKFYFRNVVGLALIRATPLFRADFVELGIGYRFYKK